MNACEKMSRGVTHGDALELQWRQILHREMSKVDTSRNELSTSDKVDLQDIWSYTVDSYTSCNITKATDIFPAIAGVAKGISEACNEDYVAGLWKHRLVEQLNWKVRDCRTADGQPSKRRTMVLGPYCAPTWTWPSVDEVIEFSRRVRQRRDYILNVVGDPKIHFKDPTIPFGELTGGSLDVEGQLYNLHFVKSTEATYWKWQTVSSSGGEPWFVLHPDESLTIENTRPSIGESSAEATGGSPLDTSRLTLTIVLLDYTLDFERGGYSGHGLALRSEAVKSEAVKGLYSRIGLVQFRSLNGEVWQQVQDASIRSSGNKSTASYGR